ncbi:MAG: hypothetical protein AB7U18_21600 [Dehalococcoidia bacterium]
MTADVAREAARRLTRAHLIEYVVGWHLIWGTAFLYNPDLIGRIAILVGTDTYVEIIGARGLGALLVACALSAGIGLALEHRLRRNALTLLTFPQLVVVISSGVRDLWVIYTGDVPGRPPGSEPLATEVLIVVCLPLAYLAIKHTEALLERRSNWKA